MLKRLLHLSSILVLAVATTSCDLLRQVENKARTVNNYERTALNLAKENRLLKVKVSELEFRLKEIESKRNYLKLKLEQKKNVKRTLASVSTSPIINVKNDLVRDHIYKWNPAQMLAISETEFSKKNFEKSAQFYTAFLKKYPKSKGVNDQVLLQAGIAAFESGNHYDWSIYHLSKLIGSNPTSPYFRGAKLYRALAHLKLNHRDEFFKTVEEFRLKYRNTPEWRILSGHYEEFAKRYKK